MISAHVTFFKSTPYFDKETSNSTSSEPKGDFMFFLENSSSYFNVDPMPQRYGYVYTRCVESTINVPVIHVSLITDTILSENVIFLLILILNLTYCSS